MIGKTVSTYKILEKLGEGTKGVVYKAEDIRLNRTVALKFLSREITGDKENRGKFEKEVQTLAALHHPTIVTTYQISEHEGQVYIVMEYLQGRTLKERIDSQPMPLEDIVNIASQLCDGLGLAHDLDIIHRNIKPQNILVGGDGQIKIMDFGLAHLTKVKPLSEDTSTSDTLYYKSPEQVKDRDLDHRSDIWSLGVILYEMITGQLPFEGENEQDLIEAIINDSPKPIKSIRPGVSTKVTRLVDMLLSKTPDQRFANCADIRRFLDIVFDQEPDTLLMRPIKSDSTMNWFKKWLIIAVLAVILIFLALMVGKKVFKSSPEDPEAQNQSMASLPLVRNINEG